MEKPIIVLTGPTASGKTAMSLELAKQFNGEVVAVDSMTVYKGLDIGTDKPRATQNDKQKTQKANGFLWIEGVKHHLIDVVEPEQDFNVSDFKKLASEKIIEIQDRGNLPFLVGGSVLYLDALVYDYQMPEVVPDQKLRAELEQKSNEELFKQLVELDPDAEWVVDKDNKRRLVRALEVTLKSGIPFTSQKQRHGLPNNIHYLAVEKGREKLYADINRRVDEMMDEGFLDEVRALYQKYGKVQALEAAGYKQMIQYLEGKIELAEAVEKTKQAHRNYAKRQLTWLRRNPDVFWIENLQEAQSQISNFLNKN